MPLFAIAALSLACAFVGGGVGAGLALAGGLAPELAALLSLPAAAAASYAGWRTVAFDKMAISRRNHARARY